MPKNVYNAFFDKDIYEKVCTENKTLLEDYLLELKQNQKSEGTIYQYKRDIMGFFVYAYRKLDNASILTFTKKDFRRYSLYLQDLGLSNARQNRLLSSLRSMLSFAEDEDDYEYDINIAKKVRGLPKQSVREIFYLTDNQILKIRDVLMERKEYQRATLLMLAYDSSGRKNELSQVEKHSFYDSKKSSTNKVIGKRKKVFRLLYFSGTKECVVKWLEQRGEDDINSLWFVNSERPTSNVLYDWTIEMRDILYEIDGANIDFNLHSMRHACLQNLSDGSHYVARELGIDGFPIEKLKLIANHISIETTQSYLKDNSIDELENMFNIKID